MVALAACFGVKPCAHGASASTQALMPSSYVALLRGVNVSGKNMLPMKALERVFVDAGCSEVRTYIQSGNVTFRANTTLAKRLPDLITAQILQTFGFRIPVILRTAEQMAETIRNNPYLEKVPTIDFLYVMFLADRPSQQKIDALDHGQFVPDEFIVSGDRIYLRLPKGAGRSKLTNAYFDSRLGTISTSRNWRTVNKLLEMMQE
jgi:uncharacterized protein (DUF1697 family)